MKQVKMLIIEDVPESGAEKEHEYINKTIEKYPKEKITAITNISEYKNIDLSEFFDVAILDYSLDLFGSNTENNGWIYLNDILKINPYCNIILITALKRIEKDIDSLPTSIKQLIDKKMNIKYIPKDNQFTGRIEGYLEEIINNLKARWQLQDDIIDCAILAYNELRDISVEELIKEINPKEIPGKKDTYIMDTISEKHIRKMFIPLIHEYKIVICTEEGGVQNKVIYRIDRPVFYIFSDPFDGSSAMRAWINFLINKNPGIAKLKLKEILLNKEYLPIWEEKYGPLELNSPMISIVLAERYHVVGSVLLNIFTGSLYFSNDIGNFQSTATLYLKDDFASFQKLEFRQDEGITDDKLLICTLQYNKFDKYEEEKSGKPQDLQFLIHFRECIKSHIPVIYDLKKSFKKRKQRNDFTPGPGRILFLTTLADQYSFGKAEIEKEIYSCIISSGEPLTEWVGWFAFLRHSSGGFRAYCLRNGSGNSCQHQVQRDNIKGTMLPNEISSLFKIGMMDFEVLHTGYRGSMHNYTDSLVVFFENDESWKVVIDRKLDERMQDFVKIEF